MKNYQRVAALIAELRDLADNDFERHRIDVLERDLISPPTVEVVDDAHQRFNGVLYHKIKDGHYARHDGIHQTVWRYYYGSIPEGYDIHHRDHNPVNNQLDNLQCLPRAEHMNHHAACKAKIETVCQWCGNTFLASAKNPGRFCSDKCRYEAAKEKRLCQVCGETFFCSPYSSTVTCSQKCASILRRNAVRPTITATCAYCGKSFTAVKTGRNKFCSKTCHHKFVYETSKAPRTCAYCGKIFYAAKNDDTQCCSHECANALRGLGKQFSHEKRICPECGREFETYKSSPQKYCSRTCNGKASIEKREKHPVTCRQCGKSFESIMPNAQFCSEACNRKYNRQHVREERICVVCGAKFSVAKVDKQKCCSHHCAGVLSAKARQSNKLE